jgi:hypothetical protein
MPATPPVTVPIDGSRLFSINPTTGDVGVIEKTGAGQYTEIGPARFKIIQGEGAPFDVAIVQRGQKIETLPDLAAMMDILNRIEAMPVALMRNNIQPLEMKDYLWDAAGTGITAVVNGATVNGASTTILNAKRCKTPILRVDLAKTLAPTSMTLTLQSLVGSNPYNVAGAIAIPYVGADAPGYFQYEVGYSGTADAFRLIYTGVGCDANNYFSVTARLEGVLDT